MTTGIRAGVLAASATAGVLVGFGLRQEMPARAFNAAGSIVLDRRTDGVWQFDALVTPVGVLVHIAWMIMLGIVLALVATNRRGIWLLLLAVLVSLAAFALNAYVVPPHLRPGSYALGNTAAVVVLYATLALGLAAGVALSQRRVRDRYDRYDAGGVSTG